MQGLQGSGCERACIFHSNFLDSFTPKQPTTVLSRLLLLVLQLPQFSLPPQPWEVGWKLQDGTRINKDLHQLMTDMLTQMNKASATLPALQSATQ